VALHTSFGNDYDHQNAFKSFDDMDELAKLVNARVGTYNVSVRYGGVEDYVQAVHALGLEWPVLSANETLPNGNRDFMVYATGEHEYWSGYYSSRPKLKGYARTRDGLLRSAELLATAAAAVHTAAAAAAAAAPAPALPSLPPATFTGTRPSFTF
jgi:hypothetical protein